MIYFRQCEMTKPGRMKQVAWLPEKFAVKGKTLKLKEDDGWLVEFVGSVRLTQHSVGDLSYKHAHYRSQTDV